MKPLIALLLTFAFANCHGQIVDARDSMIQAEHWGESTTEETKYGHIGYARANETIEIDIFLEKLTNKSDGSIQLGVSMSGSVQDLIYGNISYLSGIIWEPDLDKFIYSLHFINDSLLKTKPVNKVSYTNNLKYSTMELAARYDSYQNINWTVTIYFDANSWITLDNADCNKLAADLLLAKGKLKNL